MDLKTQKALEALVDRALAKYMKVDPEVIPGGNPDGEREGKWKSFGEFLIACRDNPGDARLKAGLVEGTDTTGGFLVPEEFRAQVLMQALETTVVRRGGATVMPMTTDTLNIPKVKDISHESSVHGGVVAYWTEEAGDKTIKEPTFGKLKLIAHKLTGYTYASDELLADSAIGLEALLIQLFGDTIGWYEDYAFLRGSGVGQPLGVLNSGALISPFRSALNTVALADIAAVWSRMLPSSHTRAVWIASSTTMPQLLQLATTSLTWLSVNQGLADAPPSQLLGRPLFFSEKVPTLGSVGDIGLYDLSKYLIGDRQDLTIASSIHLRFLSDETAWRFVKRVDGQPWVDSAFTPKNGDTMSPFVTLASTTS